MWIWYISTILNFKKKNQKLLIISWKLNWLCNFFEIINKIGFFDLDNFKKSNVKII